MHLADEVCQARGGREDVLTGGIVSSVAAQLPRAERFDLSDEVVLACENLARSKPSSLLAAIPLCRLPYPNVWFEWRGGARPDRQKPNDPPAPRRIGCLLEASGADLQRCSATWVWHHPSAGLTVCPLGVIFEWKDPARLDTELRETLDFTRTAGLPPDWAASVPRLEARLNDRLNPEYGQIADALKGMERWQRYASSLSEVQAAVELGRHSESILSRHAMNFVVAVRQKATAQMTDDLMRQWQRDLTGEPVFVQAAVALLNSRNCIEQHRDDLGQLNKAREKRGKPPLMEFVTTRIALSRVQQHAADSAGVDRRTARQHLVRGHFKVRRSGIYWWSPFLRGDPANVVPRVQYSVRK